ncbi:hypothetical protein C8Q80DRAFT_776860 [Daedaleopsis nitida]|nr:hypothetical protein C8Q80DRAFT_776860 [Daedaleopsis nitida]
MRPEVCLNVFQLLTCGATRERRGRLHNRRPTPPACVPASCRPGGLNADGADDPGCITSSETGVNASQAWTASWCVRWCRRTWRARLGLEPRGGRAMSPCI